MKTLLRTFFLVALVSVTLVIPSLPEASAAPTWAPAATAAIHPGVQTFTAGAQCTANFVFFSGTTVYIGQAAHCSGTGASTETNGCTSHSLPIGTPVDVGGVATGTLAYNSWINMQVTGESNPDVCAYNDLALIRLSPADAAKVNPSIPFWGGPTGLGGATAAGDKLYSYGNSSLLPGPSPISPIRAISLGDAGNGWSHTVYGVRPGIPGDSGSAFLNASGKANGVLSTVAIAPLAGSNGVGDIAHELAYLNSHTTLNVTLANGTEPFTPNRLS
jgi:hypothetical protein